MHNLEQLLYSTVFIEASNGLEAWMGTGFFCQFQLRNGQNAIALVSCRHVLEDAKNFKFKVNQRHANGMPGNGIATIEMVDGGAVILHPDPEIDLAAMIIHHIDRYAAFEGPELFYRTLSENMIPNGSQWADVFVGDDVFVPGCPSGLHDEFSKLPFLRKGIIANLSKYKNHPTLYVDVPTFDGQSGSPVVIDSFYSYSASINQYELRNRFYLVGVITDGCENHEAGKVQDLHFGKAVRSDQLITLFEALNDHYKLLNG